MSNLYSKEQKTLSKQGRKNWDRIFKKKKKKPILKELSPALVQLTHLDGEGGYIVEEHMADGIQKKLFEEYGIRTKKGR